MTNSSEYAQWRLETAGGIKYRFLGTSGNFRYDEGAVDWRCMIRSQDLVSFVTEIFPPPLTFGNITIPVRTTMPGFAGMGAVDISFESQVDGKPIDVFDADSNAPGGTYHEFLECTVRYETTNGKEPDPNDPRTYLEISANEGGEFIYAPPNSTKLVEEENDEGTNDEEEGDVVEPNNLRIQGNVTEGDEIPNRNPISNSTILVPTTEWTVKWKQINADIFRDVIIHRLRHLKGRLNSTPVPVLYNAAPETLLFAGFRFTEAYTWRDAFLTSPPIDIEMKIIEKRVVWRGVVIGHNHVWQPGYGWRRMRLSSGENPYRLFDFNSLTAQ